ncbi:hypothetical protein J4E91_006127 [Alternaria rosae]|nr:hypothetical protein J4E91_006127 [Alternaria rosae]
MEERPTERSRSGRKKEIQGYIRLLRRLRLAMLGGCLPRAGVRIDLSTAQIQDFRVREHHKHYRIENDADYDPERLKSMYYSEDGWESGDDLEYEEPEPN